ncbi:MAG: phage tail protein [Chloroflexi bacterium]|nr:phage tail protein [Chloroflexota bacterium]
MATGARIDPFVSFNFLVEIDGITRAAFQEVSGGIEITIEPIDHREGGDITRVRKLPGMTQYANIVLKRGMTDDVELYQWILDAAEGRVVRKNGSIIILDRTGTEVARYNFFDAWPTKYTGPTFNAETSDVAIETLELAHEGIRRAI